MLNKLKFRHNVFIECFFLGDYMVQRKKHTQLFAKQTTTKKKVEDTLFMKRGTMATNKRVVPFFYKLSALLSTYPAATKIYQSVLSVQNRATICKKIAQNYFIAIQKRRVQGILWENVNEN